MADLPPAAHTLRILALLVLFAAPTPPARAGNNVTAIPAHVVADPTAPRVTTGNLLASERFWPYRVTLVSAWAPATTGEPLKAGSVGVLVRVEESGLARIDFGRNGIHEVPVTATDLLTSANSLRSGLAEKQAPNFLFAIAPRLASSASPRLEPFPYGEAAKRRLFLCVFAAPESPEFAAVAGELAPLADRAELLTIVFPQGSHPDLAVRGELRALHWEVPFLFKQFAGPYTRSLIGSDPQRPTLLLQSLEGRTLFRNEWEPGVVKRLEQVLDRDPAGRVADGS